MQTYSKVSFSLQSSPALPIVSAELVNKLPKWADEDTLDVIGTLLKSMLELLANLSDDMATEFGKVIVP